MVSVVNHGAAASPTHGTRLRRRWIVDWYYNRSGGNKVTNCLVVVWRAFEQCFFFAHYYWSPPYHLFAHRQHNKIIWGRWRFLVLLHSTRAIQCDDLLVLVRFVFVSCKFNSRINRWWIRRNSFTVYSTRCKSINNSPIHQLLHDWTAPSTKGEMLIWGVQW